MTRRTFPAISSDAFVSQGDRVALEALQKVPLLPDLVRKFYDLGLDRWMYVYNLGRSVRCGPRQCSTLYEIMRESCAILDMPEPELYISSNPFPNAFAGGVERPYIVVRSAMIENLNDEELYHLMGHELGHIKAGHVLYFSVASILFPLLEMVGRRTLGMGDAVSIGLVMAFYEWSRQAEVSADREAVRPQGGIARVHRGRVLGGAPGGEAARAAGPARRAVGWDREAQRRRRTGAGRPGLPRGPRAPRALATGEAAADERRRARATTATRRRGVRALTGSRPRRVAATPGHRRRHRPHRVLLPA